MTRSNLPDAEGFVLIGGRSSRLGFDKARHALDDIPAADVLARRLESVCSREVRLIGRASAPWSSFACLPDLDSGAESQSEGGAGPLAGVLTALEECLAPFAVILAVDLWAVSPMTLERTLAAVSANPVPIGDDVVYAVGRSGREQPLCSAWRVETCTPIVRGRLRSGSRSMFGVLDALRASTVEVDDEELLNVNEPGDVDAYHGRPRSTDSFQGKT